MSDLTKEFVITRVVNAPRTLVFDVWTQPEHLEKWWGPAGMNVHVSNLELKPGGIFHYCMRTPDGMEMWGMFLYREIIAPGKLVFVASFSNREAGIARHPMSEIWPLEVLSTIVFTEQDGKTTLTMTATPINANDNELKMFFENFEGMNQGWAGTLAQLDTYLQAVVA